VFWSFRNEFGSLRNKFRRFRNEFQSSGNDFEAPETIFEAPGQVYEDFPPFLTLPDGVRGPAEATRAAADRSSPTVEPIIGGT